jgi:hypothetical protein
LVVTVMGLVLVLNVADLQVNDDGAVIGFTVDAVARLHGSRRW